MEAAHAAAQPPEFCLLWIDTWWSCLTRSEWASWAQAFGTVAMILVVYWQVHKQHRLLMQAESRRALESQVTELEGVLDVLSAAIELLETAYKESETHKGAARYAEELHDETNFRATKKAFDSLDQTVASNVSIAVLCHKAQEEFASAREVLNELMRLSPMSGWGSAVEQNRQFVGGHLDELATVREAISSKLNLVRRDLEEVRGW